MEKDEPIWNLPPWLGTFFLSEYYFELKGSSPLMKLSTSLLISHTNLSLTSIFSNKNFSRNNKPMEVGNKSLIWTKNKGPSMPPSSTVHLFLNFRLVFKRCRWIHWFRAYEKSQEIHSWPWRNIKCSSHDKIQISNIRSLLMGSSTLRSSLHIQKWFSFLFMGIHQR